MKTTPRGTTPIDRVYVHVNVGPEIEGGAQSLVNYLNKVDAGYHVVVDDKTTIAACPDYLVPWATGGDNSHSLAVCIIGYADQTAAEWADPYSTAAIERAAQQVATWCKTYNVPVARIRAGCPSLDRGIGGHVDCTCAASGGHYDPGPNFPWTTFINRVHAILFPEPAPPSPATIAFFKMVASFVIPIRAGDTGPKVDFVRQLIHKRNPAFDIGPAHTYGPKMVDFIRRFKLSHGYTLKTSNGKICGLPCVKKLIAPK